jgi:hypothetical protein
MKKYIEKICTECNVRPVNCTNGFYSYTCVPCVSARQKRIKLEESNKNKYVKEMSEKRIKCIECQNYFTPHSHSYGLCSEICSRKNVLKKENEVWKDKAYDGTPKPLKGNSQAVAYSFFRKKYGVKNKFKACRG